MRNPGGALRGLQAVSGMGFIQSFCSILETEQLFHFQSETEQLFHFQSETEQFFHFQSETEQFFHV